MSITKSDVIATCKKCEGKGKVVDAAGASQRCKSCEGRGKRLTDAGEAIRAVVSFMRANGELG